MSGCSSVQEEVRAVATLQTMTRYYFIIYGTNFAVAGRRFSDSAPLEARIKLPSVGWIKTLITSGDIYWTAFAGVRTGSRRRPPRFTSALSRVCFSAFLLRSRSPHPLSTFGANFCRSARSLRATIVSQTTVLTTFMREISSLARQITPPRLSLNPSPASLPPPPTDTLSTLISSHSWNQAILARTKATVFNRAGHFYEPGITEQNYRATY